MSVLDRPTLAERFRVTRRGPELSAYDVVLDVTLEELEDDPYPIFDFLREHSPVAYVPDTERVLLSTWKLCADIGLDPGAGPSAVHDRTYGSPNLMSLTGVEHRSLRDAANGPFRPKAVHQHEADARAVAVHYIESVRPLGRAELMGDVLERISQRAIGERLGLGDADDETLNRWFHEYAASLVDFGRDAEQPDRTAQVRVEIRDFLAARQQALGGEADDTAVGRLLFHANARSVPDIEGTVGLMIVGGFQEPAHLVGSTLIGIFSDAESADLVRADPRSWSAPAIEEGLRWLSPFSLTEKLLTDDVVVEVSMGGSSEQVRIEAGTELALVVASSNRDPSRFAEPETFDLRRADQGNQSFGFGGHFCVGHAAARSLGRIVIEELFERLPGLRLDPESAPIVHGYLVRGAKSLPLVWDV